MREVRCLSDDMLSSEGCDEQLRPAEKEDCHPEPCVPHIGQSSSHILSELLLMWIKVLLIILSSLGSMDYCCEWKVAS